jgi:hypothetical protein
MNALAFGQRSESEKGERTETRIPEVDAHI